MTPTAGAPTSVPDDAPDDSVPDETLETDASGPVRAIDGAGLPDTYPMEVSDSPNGLAVSDEAIWVSNGHADTVSRIDRVDGEVAVTTVGDNPVGLVAGFGAIWVSNSSDDTISRIDPTTRQVTDVIDVARGLSGLAATDDAVWVASTDDDSVSRIDLATRSVTDTITVDGDPRDVVATAEAIWVASDEETVIRIDTQARTVTGIVSFDPFDGDVRLGHSDGDPWVVGTNSVSRIDPVSLEVALTVPVDRAAAVALSQGSLWVVTLPESYGTAYLAGQEPAEIDTTGALRRINAASLAVTLRGHVLNAIDDSPLPGVVVVACLQTSPGTCVIATQTMTDAHGAFAAPVAGPGKYVILYGLDGSRPNWDGMEFSYQTRGSDPPATLTEFYGDIETLETPFVRTSLDEDGPIAFSGYFYSGDLGLGSVWVDSEPVGVTVAPAGGFIDLRVWDRVATPEEFEPVVTSTDEPGDNDDGPAADFEEPSAAPNDSEPSRVFVRDDFDGALDPDWEWLNEDPTRWSLDEVPGSISIVAQDVGPDGTHNMLVRSIPKRFDPDAFLTVSTRVAFDPTSNFQFAGLMIGGADPDVDRLQLGRSYCDVDVCALGGLYFDRIESGNFVGDNYALPFENTPGLFIQLAAREFSPGEWVVLGAYSFDGED